ncbi:MAG TPA: ATP-dependent DNA helicase RecQ [Chloroflexia bacterium]|nr:ATP-dependent DNA helicase RecQ [Chloroflexia bacterium]
MSTAISPQHPQTHLSLRAELTRLFGHERFQGMQEEVVAQVMSGTDTIAIMPTGAGKSLCYQLPAMLLPGATLIISPLIALMKDQFDSLPADVYGRTTFINSTLDSEELSKRVDDIIGGKYKLVYCAPERLRQQPFVHALRRARISLLVVDEAHCVSMWGHDFRPDYLFIGKCLPQLGHPILLALTATATPQIRDEISQQLGRPLKPVVASVFRPNLFYEVEELADKEQKMRRLIEICKEERGPGVIYARSREDCEQLAAMLRRSGIQAAHYHAGMAPDERTHAQESFMLDRVRVIVATIAFGMGIDKSNVRFIVHFSPPASLESYVQESGRAGRDGRPARCILFFSQGDKRNLTRWKRQEQLKVEELRAIYRELARVVPAGTSNFVNLEALETQARASPGKVFDGTHMRVGISLLERVGLIMRHPDSPRTVNITLTSVGMKQRDAEFMRFTEAASLTPNQPTRREVAHLCIVLATTPTQLERLLLDWAEQGWVQYRGERRDPVVERLQPPGDMAATITRMLEQNDSIQQRQIAQVMDYADAERCRHQMLAAHLGEQIEECETSCDNCAPPANKPESVSKEAPDLPENPAQVIVECLASFPFNVGKPSLVKALTGSAASNVRSDRVRHFGKLAAASGSSIERAIDELVEAGYLGTYESTEGYRLLQITDLSSDGVPAESISLKAKKRKEPKERATPEQRRERQSATSSWKIPRSAPVQPAEDRPPTPEEADLFERLRAWRRVVANRLNLPPYVIFHNTTLWAIARARPTTEEELIEVKGVGRSHIEKYGPDLLSLMLQEAE